MNEDKNYLSLGNIFESIKELSTNKKTAMQAEIFCSVFNTNDINNTTVNNYCIGYRPISIEYKKIYYDLIEKYKSNYEIFLPIVISIINILEDHINQEKDLMFVNNNYKLNRLCNELVIIAKNDEHLNNEYIKKMESKIKDNNLYEVIVNLLIYAIIENNQPVYIQNINFKINKNELEDYLKIKLYEGVSYIRSLQELSKKNNMYANAELGSLEFSGLVSGLADYNKSYNYYLKAALKNHPKACFMVAYLIVNKKVSDNYDLALKYLEQAILYDSSAALNMMGNLYNKGIIKKKNIERAIFYYTKSADLGYVYAFNNLGLIKEKEEKYGEALYYYKISADLGESWALNKVGEHYRKTKDLETAYLYYIKSSECPISERNFYSYYNLAKYYYLKDNKNYEKGIKYLIIAKENNIDEADKLLKSLEENNE